MSDKTETITLTVTETTEAEGYERNVYGVANMLDDDDGDHWEVVNTVQPRYFDAVTDRGASTEVS